MTLDEPDTLVLPAPHRWTIDEFFLASGAGVFDDRRVELIEGEIIDMPAQKDPHAWTISRLVREMIRIFPDPYWVKIQATFRLNKYSGPEPDVAVMSGPPSPPAANAPVPLLFVEVSETTLSYDLGAMASLYASHGIADYWVADVIAQQVHLHRNPIPDASRKFGWGYGQIEVFGLDKKITPLAKPGEMIDVSVFLG